MGRSAPAEPMGDGIPELEEIVMFFVGDGEISELVTQPRRSLAERLGVAVTREPVPEVDQATSNLVPGMRTGQGMDEPRRTGFHEEILVTLHADPVESIETALTCAALDAAAPRLRIERDTLYVRRNELRWTVRLRTAPLRHRAAHVRVYGSPSSNVTVLTLSPLRPGRVATRSFLRSGMRAMTTVRDELGCAVRCR